MNFDGTEIIPTQGCWCTCQLELNCVHMWCYSGTVCTVGDTCYKQCSMDTSLVVRPSPFFFCSLVCIWMLKNDGRPGPIHHVSGRKMDGRGGRDRYFKLN